MATDEIQLPEPSADLVRMYARQFDHKYRDVERALKVLFQVFPHNAVVEEVLLKVVVLNDLYHTAIWRTDRVAEHIVSLNIDVLLKTGQPEAVDLIAQVPLGSRMRNN